MQITLRKGSSENNIHCKACQAHQALVMVENVRAPSSSVVVSGAFQSKNVQLLPKSWQSFCRRALTACQEGATLLSYYVSSGSV